jgi:Tfp pilus assembly protein PilZ
VSYLNHNRKFSRKYLQKYLPAEVACKTKNSEFRASVQNISPTGAFIETDKPLSIEQEIAMIIKFPNNGDTIKVTGEIVRITPTGVGVEFKIFFDK